MLPSDLRWSLKKDTGATGRNDRRQQRCPCALLDRGYSAGPSTARKEYEGHYRRTWRNKGFGHTGQSGVLFPLVVPLAWSRHTGSASRPRFRYLITRTYSVHYIHVRGSTSRVSERRRASSVDRGISTRSQWASQE